LISPAHAAKDERLRALVLSDDLSQAVMVNEEDHLRMQTFRRGFDLGDAWQSATLLDDQIASYGDYAFTDRLGYLTSCPTNIGTGLRASVMLHLPAMTASRQTGLLQQVTKAGMTVRGFFGEGTEATGDLFQLSNQVTLGRSEEDILASLSATTKQIIDVERKLREGYREQGDAFADQCYRALGTLAYARRMTSKEAYQLLSLIRLGASLGILSGWSLDQVDKLLIMAHPGYVQFAAGKAMTDAERDRARAELFRKEILPG
ncbi:MAG: ATP--guanido phosphotransferase, partial [Peptococcaceae bacterium]